MDIVSLVFNALQPSCFWLNVLSFSLFPDNSSFAWWLSSNCTWQTRQLLCLPPWLWLAQGWQVLIPTTLCIDPSASITIDCNPSGNDSLHKTWTIYQTHLKINVIWGILPYLLEDHISPTPTDTMTSTIPSCPADISATQTTIKWHSPEPNLLNQVSYWYWICPYYG